MDSTVRVSLIAIFLVTWSKLLSEQESGESIVTGMRVVHLTEEAPMVSIQEDGD